SIICGGVPAGACNEFQEITSKPGTPLCSTVGTSGSAGEGCGPLQANGRNFPSSRPGLSGGRKSTTICTSLRNSAITASGDVRKVTDTTSTSAIDLNSSAVRCCVLPGL